MRHEKFKPVAAFALRRSGWSILEQRIDELEGLRREFKTRHTKLASLKRRERRLQKQLQRVRDHIDAVSGG